MFKPLPAEVRNEITRYVLVPGTVFIKPLRLPPSKEAQARKKPRYSALEKDKEQGDEKREISFAYLATCRQAYDEGHVMFYSENTFAVPPGDIAYCEAWESSLTPEHRNLIKALSLRSGCVPTGRKEATRFGPSFLHPVYPWTIDKIPVEYDRMLSLKAYQAWGSYEELDGFFYTDDWFWKYNWLKRCKWSGVEKVTAELMATADGCSGDPSGPDGIFRRLDIRCTANTKALKLLLQASQGFTMDQ